MRKIIFLLCYCVYFFTYAQKWEIKRWKAFSRRIRGLVKAERTLFFTTYKFRTGSMYTCMKRTMGIPVSCSVPFLKSRTGFLTESDKKQLDQFIAMYSIH